MSPHKKNCTDKSELGIDDDGNDFCMCCGEIIKTHEDQFIIQHKFLSDDEKRKESVSVKGLVATIEKQSATISDLRDKIGNLSQSMTDAYLNFAILLGLEIGKLHKLDPKILDIRIMLDGKIIVSAGKDGCFRLEFDNYNKQLEYLLCMARLVGIEDGSAVAFGTKSQAQVYHEVKQDFPEYNNQCRSCGKLLPTIDKDDDPRLKDCCEECYQNGEY